MIKIVNGSQDTDGFDVAKFYKVYEVPRLRLIAIASTQQEACDVQDIFFELKPGSYHVAPPIGQSN